MCCVALPCLFVCLFVCLFDLASFFLPSHLSFKNMYVCMCAGTDVNWWHQSGVPTGSIANHNEHYFYYHHSDGDTMSVLDPVQMNMCTAVWTAYAYVLADMDSLLPRK